MKCILCGSKRRPEVTEPDMACSKCMNRQTLAGWWFWFRKSWRKNKAEFDVRTKALFLEAKPPTWRETDRLQNYNETGKAQNEPKLGNGSASAKGYVK